MRLLQGWTKLEPAVLLVLLGCEFDDLALAAGGLSAWVIGLLRKSGDRELKLEGDGKEKTESSPGTFDRIS